MRTVLICAALMVAPAGSSAQDEFDGAMVEKWECREFSEDYGKILIKLWRINGMKEGFGYLEYAGVSFPALFKLDGLSLRWNWELDQDDMWDYSFVVKPDGTGLFYDFSGVEKGDSTRATDLYTCKSAGEEKVSEDAAISWATWALGNFRGEIDPAIAAELEEMLD